MCPHIFILIAFSIPSFLFAREGCGNDTTVHVGDSVILPEISVVASEKAKVTGLLSGNLQLNVDQLRHLPSITNTFDVLKTMELTPSVRTSGDGSSNMYVRGGDAGQNKIIYNGATSYTPGHVLGLFPLFNADHLSWAKMSKGAADGAQGDYISSVIEVGSKRSLPRRFGVRGNIGLLASQSTLDIPISAKWGAYLSGRVSYIDSVVKPLLDSFLESKSRDNDTGIGYSFWDSNLTVLGELDDRHKLSVDIMTGRDKLRISDKDLMIEGGLMWRNLLASATLTSLISDGLQIDHTVSFSSFDTHLNTEQGEVKLCLDSKIEDIAYRNKFSFFWGNLPISAGLSYTHHHIEPHRLSLETSGVTANPTQEDGIDAQDMSAHASVAWRIFGKLRLLPVLRYNLFRSKTTAGGGFENFHSLDVRFSAEYQLKEQLYVRSNFSRNNQYINKLTPSSVGLPTDFWIGATSELKPQSGNEVSLGYYQILCGGEVEVSSDIYYRSMANVTQYDYNFVENNNSSFVDNISYGKGRAYGLELMVKKNFGKLTGWLGYALSKSDRRFEGINGGKRFPARYDRTHDFSSTLSYTFNPKWIVSLNCIYATGNAYTQPTSWYFINNLPVKEYTEYNNARMPDYKRVDVGVNYLLNRNNNLNFSLFNVFAVENPIYVFMAIKKDAALGNLTVKMKKKKLYTIIPSISWNFNF